MGKRRRRFKRIVLLFVIILLLAAAGMGTVAVLTPRPPMEEIHRCQKALSEAQRNGAEEYAPHLYNDAQLTYEKAMREWGYQNEKFYLARNYDSLKKFINLAEQKARESEQKSSSLQSSLKDMVESEIKGIQYNINKFKNFYADLPLSKSLHQTFTRGQILISEGKEAYERGNLQGAAEKLKMGKEMILRADKQVEKMLTDYLEDIPKWQRWTNESIEWSKNNHKCVIIIEKMAHTCRVYKNGSLKYEFIAEFGKNWIGHKHYKGDYATPEGKYQIVKKLGTRHTKYYKALLINYPSDEDKENFNKAIKNGSLSRGAKIGDMIEIHGDGGRGINWTNGCIALTNKDMDKLFDCAEAGTPVTIIGSLRDLPALKN